MRRRNASKSVNASGVPWLAWTCGQCEYCRAGKENLCDNARFTGYTVDGGYASSMLADERFCFPIPEGFSDVEAAPLLCAGLIGYRSLTKTGDAKRLGIYGFESEAAHIIYQVARFSRPGGFRFHPPPEMKLDKNLPDTRRHMGRKFDRIATSAIGCRNHLRACGIFGSAGVACGKKGGTVVCGGIHMSQISAFSYDLLWEERTVCSVANLTRQDGEAFFPLAAQVPVKTSIQDFRYPRPTKR